MYDGQDDYSDSCDNSFLYDSELDDDTHYFNDQENIYIKYLYKIYKICYWWQYTRSRRGITWYKYNLRKQKITPIPFKHAIYM